MALNTPKRVRTLASLASSPPGSDSTVSTISPWNNHWLDGSLSPVSSCGSPEFVSRQSLQECRENRRGRPRSEALTTLMIEGSTSPSAIKCGYCNRVFPREKSLQAHLRTHTGERPYPCDYPGCSRAFTQSGQLKTHQRLHTGERPFICSAQLCQQRFTHANRHCPDHPYDQLKRCDDFVIQSLAEPNGEVTKWLEKYRMEKEDRTPTRKTPKRSKQVIDNNENVSSTEQECPSTPSNPYKSRKGLMVELDMNAGLEASPIAPKIKANPKIIQWTDPQSQGEEEEEEEEDDELSEDESEAPASSTFNPKKKWLRDAWQDDLAKPLDHISTSVNVILSPKKLPQTFINPNQMRPTVLMVASRDRTMPLTDTTYQRQNNFYSNHPNASFKEPNIVDQPHHEKTTDILSPSTGNRKWLGAMALMQLATDENHLLLQQSHQHDDQQAFINRDNYIYSTQQLPLPPPPQQQQSSYTQL